MSVCLSVHVLYVLPICPLLVYACLSICVFVHASVFLSMNLSNQVSVWLLACLFVNMSVYLCVCLSISVHICLSMRMSVSPVSHDKIIFQFWKNFARRWETEEMFERGEVNITDRQTDSFPPWQPKGSIISNVIWTPNRNNPFHSSVTDALPPPTDGNFI